VAKQYPDEKFDEDGNVIPTQVNENELDEVPFDDRVLLVQPVVEGRKIWCIN